jgi:hypothetical protein
MKRMSQNMYKPEYHSSWALIVGINQYKFVPQLSYACSDADSLTNILMTRLGFLPQQVITLKDSDATKARILEEFIDLHTKAKDPDDRVIFFFAGHGSTYQGANGPIGYLVPVEGNTQKLSSLIRWDDITKNAELITAKHILFIMDACYSGLALQRVVAPGSQRFISDMLQRFTRQVITAGKADQTVADGGGPSGQNSIFTGHLLEGLNGMALSEEGILTATSLMSYVYQKVGTNPSSQQTPHYGHIVGDGDFILLTPDQSHLKPGAASDYLVEINEDVPEVSTQISLAPKTQSFCSRRGYTDPEHPNFGRNNLTNNLGELRTSSAQCEVERAFSWFGIMIEPIANHSVSIDIVSKAKKPNSIYTQGEENIEKFSFPKSLRTTFNSLLLYSTNYNQSYWERFLVIENSGNIEYADTINSFIEFNGIRMFKFVQIIGLTWQLLFLAKSLLLEAGYRSGIRVTFMLVGTRDTALGSFSGEKGSNNKSWNQLLVFPGLAPNPKCLETNLKIEQDMVIGGLTYEKSLTVIKAIAQKVDLAFNHQGSVRCFNRDTDLFPWATYNSELRV